MSFIVKDFIVEMQLTTSAWLDISDDVINASNNDAFTGSIQNGLAFGDSSDTAFEIQALGSGTHTLAFQLWENYPIRVTYVTDSVSKRASVGTITDRDRTGDTVTYHCKGVAEKLRGTKVYSPLYYRRPAATRTTATSVEDPTDPGYKGGLLNYLAWQADGRPYEQASTYTTAPFYYSFKRSILTITWAWIAGDNGWDEAQRIAQASGGYVYQDNAGILRYETPLGFADITPSTTIDDVNNYGGDPQEQASTSSVLSKVVCTCTPRDIGASTKVVEDKIARFLEPLESQTIELQTQWPMYSIETTDATHLKDDSITITWLDGTKVPQAAGGYSATFDFKAQRILLTITNLSDRPVEVHRITISGVPILANETQIVSVGTATVNIHEIPVNPYIQDKYHALRLARMVYAVYGTIRPTRTIDTYVPDGARVLGEVIGLTVPEWSLTAAPHLVTSIDRQDADSVNTLKLVDLSGLPKTSDFFVVGSTSYASQSRKIGF
jgi:hypothetical protein